MVWLCLLNFIVLLLIRQGFCGFNLSNKSLLVNWIAWNYCKLRCLPANWWSVWSPGWKVLFFPSVNDLLNRVLLLVLVVMMPMQIMPVRPCWFLFRISLWWFKQQTYLSQRDTVVEVIKMPTHVSMGQWPSRETPVAAVESFFTPLCIVSLRKLTLS